MSRTKKHRRRDFRLAVINRDFGRCVMCNEIADVAHHITDRDEIPFGGYVLENGISLCAECHVDAEEWHSSGKSRFIKGFHPDQLYEKIRSSRELAFKKSQELANDNKF